MAEPRTGRVNRGKGHRYLLDGERIPGVTTIIGDGLPKPALMNWGIKTVASAAVDQWDELAELPVSERIEKLKKAPWEDRDTAARRGSEVHTLAEKLGAGEKIDVPEELAGHVEACVAFLNDWNPEILVAERPVFSRRHKYGGTFDLIATLADGQRWLLDYKTNRSGPFGETALQLAAYRAADFYLDEDSNEQALPAVDACGVIWLRADGYDLVPFEAGPRQHRAFLYVAQVAALQDAMREWKHDALTAPHGAAA